MVAVALARRLFRTLKWLAIGGSMAFVILIVTLLIEDGRDASLPEPSGRFAVGRVIEDWVDPAAVDPLAPVAGTPREDLVWVWYPAATPSTAPGSFHFMFSDDGVVMKSAAVRAALHVLGRLRIDARRQLAATSYCLQAFFTAHLKGPSGARPAIPSPLASEVRFVRQEPREGSK